MKIILLDYFLAFLLVVGGSDNVQALQKPGHDAANASSRTFEVASVKVNKSGAGGALSGRGGSIRFTPGQVSMENVSLWKIIGSAYGVGEDKDYAMTGAGWLKDERYDVLAKFPPDTPRDELQTMLKNLLAERFKLTLHRETKELSVYALVVAKGGSKLREVEDGQTGFNMGRGQIKAQKAALRPFADRLSQYLDRPVQDFTGLTGVFDFTLTWTPDASVAPGDASEPVSGPSIFTAIQEQLGLKLEARKGSIEVLVIDHAERIPVEN